MDEHRLAVVGLGYVGLPLALEAVNSGIRTVGLDASSKVVSELNQGLSRVDDISDESVGEMLKNGFRATSDAADIADANIYVMCVPTPLGRDGAPDLSAVEAAAMTIASVLGSGDLVVLESTTYPGTTEEVLVPILESRTGLIAGRDFAVAFSPERIDPGNPVYGLRNTPKVVGGLTHACSLKATEFYSEVVDHVVLARGPREAEMAKLLENTYRQVNIALVNEMAQFSKAMSIDIWDAIRCASTKPFGFQAFFPGPGVGGHCIPIDPNYLSFHVRRSLGRSFRFVELAQEINSGMPAYVASRAQGILNDHGKAVKGSCILLVGVTYKPDIADQRESPARPLAEILLGLGASINYWDPYVGDWSVKNTSVPRGELGDAWDLVILLQPHQVFFEQHDELRDSAVLDTRGLLPSPAETM